METAFNLCTLDVFMYVNIHYALMQHTRRYVCASIFIWHARTSYVAYALVHMGCLHAPLFFVLSAFKLLPLVNVIISRVTKLISSTNLFRCIYPCVGTYVCMASCDSYISALGNTMHVDCFVLLRMYSSTVCTYVCMDVYVCTYVWYEST